MTYQDWQKPSIAELQELADACMKCATIQVRPLGCSQAIWDCITNSIASALFYATGVKPRSDSGLLTQDEFDEEWDKLMGHFQILVRDLKTIAGKADKP